MFGIVKNMQEIKKGLLGKLILFCITSIICFVFLELAFRVLGMGIAQKETISDFIKHSSYNPFLIYGPHINKEFKQDNGENAYYNSQGFRLKERVPLHKEDGVYRIIFLGGSTTEDLANRMNVHWPEEVCKILNRDSTINKRIECLNAGTGGYSTAHSLIRLQLDLLQFNPDMITFLENINDLHVNFFPNPDNKTNYANKYLDNAYAFHYNKIYLKNILKNSRVLVVIDQLLEFIENELFSDKINYENKEYAFSTMQFSDKPIELKEEYAFKNNLISIVNIAKAHNISVVLISQPAIFTDEKIALGFGSKSYNAYIFYPKKEEFKKIFEEYNNVIKDVAKKQGAYFIDMYNLFGSNNKDFIDEVHYTANGSIRFGKIFSRELRDIIKEDIKNA